MSMNDDDIDSLARSLDDDPATSVSPPPGFADRVMAARAAGAPATARIRLGYLASAFAGAASCLAIVAVVALSGVGGFGTAHAPLAVSLSTPAGTLEGVRFTADVSPLSPQEPVMFTSSPSSSMPKTLATAAAGALVGAALTIAVSAGELTVRSDEGAVTVKPGEVATLVHGAPPTKTKVMRSVSPQERVALLNAENENLRGALEAARTASGGDVTKLVQENQQLRDKLRKAEEEVALLDDLRRDQEGEPRAWPTDLPPRFAEAALQKAFEDAMNEAGIEGGIVQMDCKEYPCLVFGQMSSKDDMEKMRASPAFQPYANDDDMTSIWHSKNKDENGKTQERAYFGVSLAPKAPGDKPDEDLTKRIRHRMQTTSDALFPRQ